MKQLLFVALFLAGLLLAGTANLQLTVGAALLAIGYTEFRKQGVSLDQIDDHVLAELRKLVNRE